MHREFLNDSYELVQWKIVVTRYESQSKLIRLQLIKNN